VTAAAESLPTDLASAHAMIIAERAARIAAEAELAEARAEAANARADLTSTEALIAHLKLAIEKLRRELYGSRSERKARLLQQMELQLEDLEAAASEDDLAARPAHHLRAFSGILQADAFGGYNGLYEPSRSPGAITPAFCWSHARRGFFELADIAAKARRGQNAAVISPIALEAVERIDALFDIERSINGLSAAERLEVRTEQSVPLVADLELWLKDQRSRLSRSASVARPIDYLLKRWPSFTRFLQDGRVCLSNNAAERALRGFALGRRSWLFAGSERGADRAAAIATLITTAKLNEVDPLVWLADVLNRLPDHPAQRLHELLPWNWKAGQTRQAAA
jgi:hypothetical protein